MFLVTLSQPIIAPPPPPTLSINSISQFEGNSGTTLFVFTVTLSGVSSETVTVNYSTQDGTAQSSGGKNADYKATSGTLTFLPGETTKTITVQVTGDKTKEADEYFNLLLSGANNAVIDELYATGIAWILNDD